MKNIDVYENNLIQRLNEIKSGDQAYQMHQDAIIESLISLPSGPLEDQRIIDCGCGLGFITSMLTEYFQTTIGIDPSKAAIDIARKEHEGVQFYNGSIRDFADNMKANNIEDFHQAILNMVLHSVDDKTVTNIFSSVKDCLKLDGIINIIIPTQRWLMRKLVEYAKEEGMQMEEGTKWVDSQLEQKKVELPVKIRNGKYYSNPLTIYNRTLDDYAKMLIETGFGVRVECFDNKTDKLINTETLPFWKPHDYTMNYELKFRLRESLFSFKLE